MTNEEMQKAIGFIINQQAQFAADVQKIQEAQAQTEQLLNRLAAVTVKGFEDTNTKMNALVDAQIRTEEKINNLTDRIDGLTDAQLRTDEKIANLIDAQIRTEDKINSLADAQMKTEENIRNLNSVVDRYFNEGRNGKQSS